jgi:hypothetical protein
VAENLETVREFFFFGPPVRSYWSTSQCFAMFRSIVVDVIKNEEVEVRLTAERTRASVGLKDSCLPLSVGPLYYLNTDIAGFLPVSRLLLDARRTEPRI